MNPGEFIARRRKARVVSREDAAAVAGLTTAELAAIEEGDTALWLTDAWRLGGAIDFDLEILGAIAAGIEVQLCRVCACSEHDPCETDDGYCGWAEARCDLCTACAEGEA